jgi:hypothetical protein
LTKLQSLGLGGTQVTGTGVKGLHVHPTTTVVQGGMM